MLGIKYFTLELRKDEERPIIIVMNWWWGWGWWWKSKWWVGKEELRINWSQFCR